MNSSKVWSRNTSWLTATGALLISSGCSLLYDFSTKQCDFDGQDCSTKGSQFAYSVCKNHVCVQKIPGTGGASAGGQSSTGIGGDSTTGGVSVGGQSVGGDANTGGTPGTGGAPACVNADCMAANAASGLYTCINGQCVQLTTADCPVVIPSLAATDQAYSYQNLLKAASPIIIGGFASMTNSANQHDTQAIVNWDLALYEFNQTTSGGLPGSPRRPLIGLICDGNTTSSSKINAAMAHLAGDIKVPGILTTLSSDNLITAFNYTTSSDYTNAGGKPVFFMSTSSASMALVTLDDHGLVWHMLGNPRLLAAPTVALIKRMEPVVNQARMDYATANPGGPDDATTANSLRVTVVSSSNSTLTDVANLLVGGDPSHPETMLSFNNSSVADLLSSGHLRSVSIASGATDPTPVVNEIKANAPHIIIAMGTSEFPKSVLPYLENVTWPQNLSNRMRPYYVMSHLLYNSTDLQNTIKNNTSITPAINTRLVGVNYAQIQDSTTQLLYQNYLTRLTSSYNSYNSGSSGIASQLPGTENMYDAAYYLFYSVAAAAVGGSSFSGTDILSGLKDKVINPGASTVYEGPSNITQTITSLYTPGLTYAMSLWGCDGPPNFDLTTGTRSSPTSAWCMLYDTGTSTWTCQADGLLYDATNKVFTDPSTGVPTCLQNY